MASLVGQQLKDTYDSLLKTSDNDALGGTYKEITDGSGNGSNLYLGTGGRVGIGASPNALFDVTSGIGSTELTGHQIFLTRNGNNEIYAQGASSVLALGANSLEKMRIDSSGDISFRDTSNSEAFYWDASAGSLGIGTDSPATALEVVNNTSNLARLRVSTTATTGGNFRGYEFGSGSTFKGGLLQDESTDMISIFTPVGGQSVNIDSSGNMGIGTATTTGFDSGADNLIIGSGSSSTGMTIYSGTSGYGSLHFADANSSPANYVGYVNYNHSTNSMQFATASTERMRIASTGDISFRDGSANEAFYWDASAGSLGIGTTSPQHKIDAIGNIRSANSTNTAGQSANVFTSTYNSNFGQTNSATFQSVLNNVTTGENDLFIKQFNHNSGSTDDIVLKAASGNSGYTALYTADTERMRIDSSGHVTVKDGGFLIIDTGAVDANPRLYFRHDSIDATNFIEVDRGTNAMEFWNNGSEAMRIDSSGNVGIGDVPKTQHSNVTDSLNVGSHLTFQRTKDTYIASNFYYNSSDVGKSIASGWSPIYLQDVVNGKHQWLNSSASATGADGTVSLQPLMIIDSSGQVGIGETNPATPLDVNGTTQSGDFRSSETTLAIPTGTATTVLDLTGAGLDDRKAGWIFVRDTSGTRAGSFGQFMHLTDSGASSTYLFNVQDGVSGSSLTKSGSEIKFQHTVGSTRTYRITVMYMNDGN